MDLSPDIIEILAQSRHHFEQACQLLEAHQHFLEPRNIHRNALLLSHDDHLCKTAQNQENVCEDSTLYDLDAALDKDLIARVKSYDPELTTQSIGKDFNTNDYTELDLRYHRLYREYFRMATSFCQIRRRLRSSQQNLRDWNHLIEQDSFETSVNGMNVRFQRVTYETPRATRSRQQTSVPESPPLPPMSNRKGAHETGPPPVLQFPDSDTRSTQSHDPRYSVDQTFLPLNLSPDSPDSPTVISERPVGRQGRERPVVAPNLGLMQSATGPTGSNTQPIDIKDEPISSHAEPNVLDYPPVSPKEISEWNQNTGVDTSKSLLIDNRTHGFEVAESTPAIERKLKQRQRVNNKKRTRQALQAVDSNLPSLHPLPKDPLESNPKSKRLRPSLRSAAAITRVAEDGDEESYSVRRRSLRSNSKAIPSTPVRTSKPNNLLYDLLETEYTPRPTLITPIIPSAGNNTVGPIGPYSAPRTPGARNPEGHILDSSSLIRCGPDCTSEPEDEIRLNLTPLRNRPIEELTIEDFRLNPNRNQGIDFAFNEVVRDKSRRKQLDGCLREDCCGPIFRAMAVQELGDKPYPRKTLKDKHYQLLCEHLGSDCDEILARSLGKEIRDMLVEAKTKALSNQHSKHRHAHAKDRSPPGYWRTDMPTTQEAKKDREIAQKHQREKVLGRYKEACKDDGKWMFVDE
ncbi:hypothetical protein FQN57_005590 [Myotisia sp. PD_48]|nr:hypothetical protein FQN57_005590 [Myotisia sp. PD_48]